MMPSPITPTVPLLFPAAIPIFSLVKFANAKPNR